MADEYIGILSNESGRNVAMRDSSQQTAGLETRQIQIFSEAYPQLSVYPELRSSVSTADTTDVTFIAWQAYSNLIFVGDASQFILFTDHYASDGTCTLTPIVLEKQGSYFYPVAYLSAKTSNVGNPALIRTSLSISRYLGQQQIWETEGAQIIMIHITAVGGTSNNVTVYGGCLDTGVTIPGDYCACLCHPCSGCCMGP